MDIFNRPRTAKKRHLRERVQENWRFSLWPHLSDTAIFCQLGENRTARVTRLHHRTEGSVEKPAGLVPGFGIQSSAEMGAWAFHSAIGKPSFLTVDDPHGRLPVLHPCLAAFDRAA
jgi:hypothetical protein